MYIKNWYISYLSHTHRPLETNQTCFLKGSLSEARQPLIWHSREKKQLKALKPYSSCLPSLTCEKENYSRHPCHIFKNPLHNQTSARKKYCTQNAVSFDIVYIMVSSVPSVAGLWNSLLQILRRASGLPQVTPVCNNGSLTLALLERQMISCKIGRTNSLAFKILQPNKVDRPSAEENKQLTELSMSSAVLKRLHHDLYTQTHTLFKDVV